MVRGARRNDSLVTSPSRRHRLRVGGWASVTWRQDRGDWRRERRWIGGKSRMGKAKLAGWSLRRVRGGHTHRESRGPSPLGPGGTPLEPALTHSTSGAVTGSNARLGTSKGPLFWWSRDTLPTLSCPRYTPLPPAATQITRVYPIPRSSSQVDRSTISEEWWIGAGDLGPPRKGKPGPEEIRRGNSSSYFIRRFLRKLRPCCYVAI